MNGTPGAHSLSLSLALTHAPLSLALVFTAKHMYSPGRCESECQCQGAIRNRRWLQNTNVRVRAQRTRACGEANGAEDKRKRKRCAPREVRTALHPTLAHGRGSLTKRTGGVIPSSPQPPAHLGGHSFDVGRNDAFKSVGVLLSGVDDGLCLLPPEELLSGDNICGQRTSPEGSTNLPLLGSTEFHVDPLLATFK